MPTNDGSDVPPARPDDTKSEMPPELHAWLTDVLTRLPTTKSRDIDTLLPLA